MRLANIPHPNNRGNTVINTRHIVKVEFFNDQGGAAEYGSPNSALLRVGIYLSTGAVVWTTRDVYEREVAR